MLKKGICFILSLLVLAGVIPAAQVAVADASLNLYDITSTNYGVIDKDVVATRFAEGEGYEIVYPENPDDYEESDYAYATPCVIIREAYDGSTYKYSLVSSHRVVKTYLATEKPKIQLLSMMDDNGNYPAYCIYRVYNPQTGKYDVYNANSDTYYEYGVDQVVSVCSFGCNYEYWSDCYQVTKDSKYGMLDKTGKMIYEPIYKEVRFYKNCGIGWGTGGEYDNKMAILSSDGRTDGKKFYVSGIWQDEYLIGVRDRNTADELKYAAISPKTLKVLTDYKYHKYFTASYNGTPYLIGQVLFYDSHENTRNYYEIVYKDKVLDSRTVAGGECNSFDNSTYFSDSKYQYGTVNFGCYPLDYSSESYRVVNLEGTQLYTSTTEDQFYKDLIGYVNRTAITYEYIGSTNKKIYKLYNSSLQAIATSEVRPEVWGDYVIGTDEGQIFIYNYMSGEMVYTGGTVVDYNLFNREYNTLANKMILLENGEGKRGLFHLQSGKFSGFVFSGEEMNALTMEVALTNGVRGAWSYSTKDNVTKYVTDTFAVIPTDKLIVSGDCLLEDLYQPEFETDRLWDYDGKVIKEWIRRDQRSYDTHREDCGFAEGWGTYDAATKLQGLITPEGKEVLGNHYTFVGETRNGLTFVGQDSGGLRYEAALVDNNGNALIYGEYLCGFMKSVKYYNRDQGGFIAFNREENNKQCVYIYDYTACLGLASGIELPNEDVLFGEYNAYLNSNFYNTAADTIANAVTNSVAKKTTASATAIALTKSGLEDGTEFVIKELLKLFPGNDINEDKICQEVALQYLEELDTETVERYIDEITEFNDFAKKVDKYYKNIKDLSKEKNKVDFCVLWQSKEFSKEDIYKLVETAQENKLKLGDVLDGTGKVITVAEYVMTYMMICSIESQLIERIMANIPSNSALYEGLAYIRLQQKDKFMTIFTMEMFTDEMIGKFADLLEEGLVSLVTDVKPSLVLFVVKTGMKLLSKTIDSSTVEDIDKAVIALANIYTLKQAVERYRKLIRENYEDGWAISVAEMKYDYEALMRSYFKSLLVGLDYAENLENEDGKLLISQLRDSYTPKLRYYPYIQTCLINATAMWEYTVEANKAVLNKLKAEFPKGEGRVPLYDLMFGDQYDLDELYGATASKTAYCIDIPEKLDGYEVGGVAAGTVSGQAKINGVYVPDTVKTVEANAFENCTGLETVLVSNGTSASDNAFSGAQTTSREKQVATIEVVTAPNQKELGMQDSLNTDGLVLKVTYVDGTTQTVTDGAYAIIENRVNGTNTVTVKYNGATATYQVNVTKSECQYTVSYVDNFGNVLKEKITATALSGETVTLDAPAIDGYAPTETQISHTIGFENDLVFVYQANSKRDIEQAQVEIGDMEFTGEELTPEPVVTVNGKTLTKGVDYTVKYDYNRMPGTAYVYIFGCGEYAGILEASFTITGEAKYGDVNGDTKVDAKDALWVLQSSVGKRTLDEQQKVFADVDGSTKIDAKDALQILRFAVKKIDKFPVEQ